MDHAQLSAFRDALARPPAPAAVRAATAALARLPPREAARELRRLPPGPRSLAQLAALLPHRAHATLVHALLASPLPRALAPPARPAARAALERLVAVWRPLVDGRPETARRLDALVAAHGLPPPPAPPPSQAPRVDELESALGETFAALENAQEVCAGNAAGHDGLQEHVRALWSAARRRRAELAIVRTAAAEGHEVSVLRRIDTLVGVLRERRQALTEVGFEVGAVTPGNSDDEDEWEEAVDFDVEDESDGAEKAGDVVQASGVGGTSSAAPGEAVQGEGEAPLPAVENWASVMRGQEGRDFNQVLLERFESRGVAALRATGEGEAEGAGDALLTASLPARGRGRGRGRGGAKKNQTTARQRLSKKLGINKKRKKKGLLDDD